MDNASLLWIATRSSGVEVLNTQLNPFHGVVINVPGEKYRYPTASFLLDDDETLWVRYVAFC